MTKSLSRTGLLMLNLGCGDRTHPEWVNIDSSLRLRLGRLPVIRRWVPAPPDIRIQDLRHGIPFGDGTADVVYASHVLEHLTRSIGQEFLREIYRVLKPGGIVRIVVPDLETAVRQYLAALEGVKSRPQDDNQRQAHEWATIYLLDQMVRTSPGGDMAPWLREHRDTPAVRALEGTLRSIADSPSTNPRLPRRLLDRLRPRSTAKTGELHRWMYDVVSLRNLLVATGFGDVASFSWRESRIADWQSYHLDNNPDGSPHQPGSLWMEGVKGMAGASDSL